MTIDQQTIDDLEFPVILDWLFAYAHQPTAQQRILSLKPSSDSKFILAELSKTKELHQIRNEGEQFPAIDFEELDKEIRLLPIHNASVSLEGFIRIKDASSLVNRLLVFFDKREKEYPLLSEVISQAYYTKDIIEEIDKVFDRNGKVRDDASEKLNSIREGIKSLRTKINRNFDREIKRLQRDNMLGETTETYISDRRVLAVLSQFKRKVTGTVHGSSNSGNFTYIEPAVNVPLNNEMELLLDDERAEIFRILQLLRVILSGHIELIKAYQRVLTEFDFINAKARFALSINGDLPKIVDDKQIELKNAFHPILWKNNKELGKATYPQTVKLDKFSRMVVISGPNAGGKSITLKSVGVLQLMLQSGLLVPVHPDSTMSIFGTILSDIGDNQSIANELSTYSYRLKRMKFFLENVNRNALILIDEFGTGSDPDLGGALAEAIFEALYSKKTFGILTTHYANIKLKADQLKNAVNGSMLFDTETLEPKYKFVMGQPGSSFTFEVATINGIPEEIIQSAKEKISSDKLRMDKLLSELQKEKNYLTKLNKEHIEAQKIAQDAKNHFEELSDELNEKLDKIRLNATKNERLLKLGTKMSAFIDRYISRSRKKTINDELMEDIRKYLAVEKTKLDEANELQKRKKQTAQKQKLKKIKPEQDQYQR
ncbi:MAG: DNA mismatch repair protein MutS, partial [Bacteroidetes bacterium]